ncbi:hypothetical protein [Paenibacillus taiwanensis]|uniref:hypothetical protein n=1 Tax=Paenibacillus taiwanensis TaxID=401638 RepID=UPI0003FDFB87|nr:hypothetical protein [Paenibacillus taiwanensis]
MTYHEENPSVIISSLVEVYQVILQDFQFERYEQYESELDSLYSKLAQCNLPEAARSELMIVKELHDQLVDHILVEKNDLNRDLIKIETGKKASNPYMKFNAPSNAFFFDQKQ